MQVPHSWALLNFMAVTLLAFCAVGIATEYARGAGLVALPGARGSHREPTPTGGGLGMVCALVLASLLPGLSSLYPPFWIQAVTPGLVLLSVIGWLDDRKSLPLWPRLLVQLAVSLWLLACIGKLGVSFATWPGPALGMLGLLALVSLMNAWNFMDGSNGMAGMQGLFTGLVMAALFATADSEGLAVPAASLAAACLGFLPWNLYRPRVFMGDAGSVPLGFCIGALLLTGVVAGSITLATAILVPAVFLVDSGLTLLKRFLRGERWYTPHRQHLYQKMIIAGWSHNRVLAAYQALNLLLVLPGLVLGVMYPDLAWTMTWTVFVVLITGWIFGSFKLSGV